MEPSQPEPQPQRCCFWLSRKNRFCANVPINQSLFCGNHNPNTEQQRIPCPFDPSHSVLKENIETHKYRCPFLKQAESLRLQPFYNKGINGGSDAEDEQAPILEKSSDIGHMDKSSLNALSEIATSQMKRNAVYKMTVSEFFGLINKIKSIHSSMGSDLQDSYKIPEACSLWMKREVDGKLPFQEKHVLQQASILGNLDEFGLLSSSAQGASNTKFNEMNDNGVPAVVEFGAGRGYLTQMLADCYGIQKVYLVERRSYKLKADRSLRQKENLKLERLRIDIEDLDLHGIESLKRVPYLAIGKHLCGPATDLTLRCCLREHCSQDKAVFASDNHLRGLAVATCCHYLCQWKHYINKSYFSNLGITKNDFHAITWFTNWAVDADHSSDHFDVADQRSSVDSGREIKECGENVLGLDDIVRNMSPSERAVLGFMCKDIIDMGRLVWIKKHGLGAQLVKYVPSNISPENHLLVAKYMTIT
ncbi:hypothetical protein AQUCO_02900077v1 [Aquilegia coerulea]|uniref:tRNA:m(4)X modification enzyme TRM13 n=1 Tax=Aquilegia coerulea TaxID=218851 RepID=A0A2G5D389_AQUCA|nr:hypothetical protein AQUCO_02900077v1 [Aquilegia coerulea]